MFERLAEIEARYEELTRLLADPQVLADHRRVEEIARERAQSETVVLLYRAYLQAQEGLAGARALLGDTDAEMREMGREEAERLEDEMARLEHELQLALLPTDKADERDVIIEIRAGTGGDEAGLFAADLFGMYQRYAERQNWKTEVLDTHVNEAGGYREITFEIHGRGAYSRMKYESGVHRVQRVPTTETQGRIHTSTATVAVMPEVDEVEVDIDWNDVRIDIFHSGGAG
ncbi:MAG: PCRF domain-containing protein, partial [Chloroflexi bacterium]